MSLSDIMGFYKAFGLDLQGERPDSLSVELEFMHYLIFKMFYATEKRVSNFEEKAFICIDAQRKFFDEYLYPGAKAISRKISSEKERGFYRDIIDDLLPFFECEDKYFEELRHREK